MCQDSDCALEAIGKASIRFDRRGVVAHRFEKSRYSATDVRSDASQRGRSSVDLANLLNLHTRSMLTICPAVADELLGKGAMEQASTLGALAQSATRSRPRPKGTNGRYTSPPDGGCFRNLITRREPAGFTEKTILALREHEDMELSRADGRDEDGQASQTL
jgi:hypothetical protein